MNGLLLINKRINVTSRSVDNKIQRLFHTRKVGHLGTLDPFASGLLIIAVNGGTKALPFIDDSFKTYEATLCLGKKTSSGDLTGEVIEEKEVGDIKEEDILKVFESFIGESEQIPPMTSALHHDGQRLYDLSRKGIEVDRKSRKIVINSLKLISFSKNCVKFEVNCSRGTYVRTLGEDIAERLGTVGYSSELERTMIDNFNVKDAIKAEDVSSSKLLSIDEMLKDFPSINVSGELASKVKNGVPLFLKCENEEVLIKDEDGIIAMYKRNENGKYTCLRGLR